MISDAATYLAQTMPQGGEILLRLLPLLFLAGFAIWIWSLIHCIRNRYLTDQNQLIGIILIVVLGPIGSAVYLFLPRDSEHQR
jgi:hypothetical protein